MKITVGTDIVEIERIKKILAEKPFLARYFSEDEQAEYYQRGEKTEYIAGSFCAKESFSKAVGTGVRGFELREVQVLRDDLGKPHLTLTGNAKTLAEAQGLAFDVSISHTKEYATAVVIAYTVQE